MQEIQGLKKSYICRVPAHALLVISDIEARAGNQPELPLPSRSFQ